MESRGDIFVLLPGRDRYNAEGAMATPLVVRDQCNASRDAGRTVVFGAPVKNPFPGVRFHALEPHRRWLYGLTKGNIHALAREARRHPPRLIEFHSRQRLSAMLARLVPEIPVVCWCHMDPGLVAPRWRRRMLARCAGVVCVSDFIRQRFLEGLNVSSAAAAKVHVLYNGVPRPFASPPVKEKLIVYVGRFLPDKGVVPLAEALQRIMPQALDWRAVLVGGLGSDPGYEAQIRSCISSVPSVSILPAQSHDAVMELFGRAAIMVIPSVWGEPGARTAAEGLAAGCAVVASKRGGLPEVVEGRGVLVDEPDADSLAAALSELIRDDGKRAHLQQRAWDDFPFSVERVGENLDALRRKIVPSLDERN